MNPDLRKHTRRRLMAAVVVASTISLLPAQNASTEEAPIQLSAFTVDASSNRGYHAANVLSGTRSQIALKDLPQTINVVTSEFFEDIGARNVESALFYTPGVRKSTEFEGILSVRGFREANQRLNGFPTATGGRWDPIALERVEIVKGPSAALYGSSASAGGFANLITKKPQFTAARSATFSASSEGRTYTGIDLTGPLVTAEGKPQVAYRFVGSYQDGSHVDWRDFADGQREFYMPAITVKLGTGTSITIEHVRDDYDRVMDQVIQPLKAPDQALYFFDELKPEMNLNGPDSFDWYKNSATYLYITQQLGRTVALRGVVSRQNFQNYYLRRSGFNEITNQRGFTSTFPVFIANETDRRWSRLDAQWKDDFTAGEFMLLAGVQRSDDIVLEPVRTGATRAFPLFAPMAADYAMPGVATGYPLTQDRETQSEQTLGNAVASWKFLKRYTIFGSYARILDHKSRQINRLTGGNEANTRWTTDKDPDDYQVGLVAEITRELNAYAVLSRDRSLNAFNDAGVRLANLEQDMTEIGLKYSSGSWLSANLALFNIERANIAQRDFSNPLRPLIPAGNVRSRGVELEVFYNPTEQLTFVLGYTHLDAKVTENVTRPGLVGVPLGDSPENYVSLWSRYTLRAGPAKGLQLALGVLYSEAFHPFGGTFDIQNRAFARVPGYTVLNAMARYPFKLAGRNASVQLNVNNLTDKVYFLATDFGAPRHADLSLNFEF